MIDPISQKLQTPHQERNSPSCPCPRYLSLRSVNNHALTHWGRVTHICVSKLSITGSDNGLSPDRRQVIIWANVGILLIGPLGTNFSEILIEIRIFLYKKMTLKISSAKWRSFCLGLNVLTEALNILGPKQHCHHWAGDNFKCLFLSEDV